MLLFEFFFHFFPGKNFSFGTHFSTKEIILTPKKTTESKFSQLRSDPINKTMELHESVWQPLHRPVLRQQSDGAWLRLNQMHREIKDMHRQRSKHVIY